MSCSRTETTEVLLVYRTELVKAVHRLEVDTAIAESLLAQSVEQLRICDEQMRSAKQLLGQIDSELEADVGTDLAEDDIAW